MLHLHPNIGTKGSGRSIVCKKHARANRHSSPEKSRRSSGCSQETSHRAFPPSLDFYSTTTIGGTGWNREQCNEAILTDMNRRGWRHIIKVGSTGLFAANFLQAHGPELLLPQVSDGS